MIRLMRNLCALAAVLVCVSQAASADLKIKTRTTVMGHTTESTVYIKGARQRSEMSYGGRAAAVSIMQCDQKRMITVSGNNCVVIPLGGEQMSCPAAPFMGGEMAGAEPAARKGGTLTITRSATDTGERRQMFGYKARHIRTSMSMEPSPDACNQSRMKMETDGWYADLSADFSCGDESFRAVACGGMGRGRIPCSDRIVMKGSGGGALGFPLKQTTTITSDQGTFTSTTEVVELTNASLDAPLFDAPPGCRVMEMSAMMRGPSAAAQPAPAPAPPPKAEATPAAPPPPAVAPKAAGVVRVGVVKLKDASGEELPTDNLRMNLISELARRHIDVVPLETEAPHKEVESEARSKQCDYILYTTLLQVKEAGSGGLPPASVPKGTALDAAKYQALTGMTLYRVVRPHPEIKDLHLAADDAQLGVNAVMTTFETESDKVAQQIEEDAHPKPASKAPARRPAPRKRK